MKKEIFLPIIMNPKVAVALHDGAAMRIIEGFGANAEEKVKTMKVDFSVTGPDATHAAIPIELFREMLITFMTYVRLAVVSIAPEGKIPEEEQQTVANDFMAHAATCFDIMNDWFVGAVNNIEINKQKGGLN